MGVFIVKCGILCLFSYAVNSVKEPLSVTRDVLDSFRADEFSCLDDTRVCTRRNAVCQPDGSCLCRNDTPDYVNPKLSVNYGYLTHGIHDGCMSLAPIIDSIDPYNLACSYSFHPYQLVSNTRQEKPNLFIHSAGTHYSFCNFSNALVKYPSSKTWVPMTWLNENHVEINMTYVGVLLFRWRVPVPELEGHVVVINLHCSRIELNNRYKNDSIAEQCLRMKVYGTKVSSGIDRVSVNLFKLIFLASVAGLFQPYMNT